MDNKLNNTIQRVKYFIDYKGFSLRQFSKNISASHTLISNAKSLGSDKLENILNAYPEISAEWLITGKGEMLKSDNENSKEKNNSEEIIALQKKIIALQKENIILREKNMELKAKVGFHTEKEKIA